MQEAVQQMIEAGEVVMAGVGSDIAKDGRGRVGLRRHPAAPAASACSTAAAALEGRMADIACPVLIVTSPQDHVVDPANSDLLAASVAGPVERVTAPDSYHVVTLDHDADDVIDAVVRFCTKVCA